MPPSEELVVAQLPGATFKSSPGGATLGAMAGGIIDIQCGYRSTTLIL